MKYPRQEHPEIPYFAAQVLEAIANDLPRIVTIPEGRGEDFAREIHTVAKKLATVRRAMLDRGILGDVSHGEQ